MRQILLFVLLFSIEVHAKKALLVIDVQKCFTAGGSLEVKGGDEIVDGINELVRDGGYDLIVASQDWHPQKHISFASTHGVEPFSEIEIDGEKATVWPDHCVQPKSPGQGSDADFQKDLRLPTKNKLLVKKGMGPVENYSAFLGENPNNQATKTHSVDLKNELQDRGIDQVDVVGLAFDYCVMASAIDSADAKFKTRILFPLTRYVGKLPKCDYDQEKRKCKYSSSAREKSKEETTQWLRETIDRVKPHRDFLEVVGFPKDSEIENSVQEWLDRYFPAEKM